MKRPDSATSLPINLAGLLSFLVTLFILSRYYSDWSGISKLVVVSIALALPIILLEFIFRRPRLLSRQTKKRAANSRRIAIKLLALYAIWGLIAFIYWVFPEYHGSFYQPYWALLVPAIPWLIGLAIPYFWFVDQRMEKPEDAYYRLGQSLLGKRKLDKPAVTQLLLGWLVKLFFLPLMVVYLNNNLNAFHTNNTSWDYISTRTYDFFWLLLFTIDLAFVTVGYMLTMRLLDSHIRSTEPTLLGWVSAIICYQPFMGTLSTLYLAYNLDSYTWGTWLQGNDIAYGIWGGIIIACLLVYALASVMFGIRFSNLTHRGIITNGPFRYSKHPAYLSKNLSWWMVSIPFISQSGDVAEAIRSSSMLLVMNGIYYIRAKTEERHLLQDPVYQEYAAWINQHGLLARLKRMIPGWKAEPKNT
jgi:protein-S-isoprenylcysteine O-methyltransferase Ste14